ncbi:hypothetical protein ID866_10718 [Astraeus odoratus]|nr:hypothetical protein ID866_10718 [Astraeus odoratus]
MAEPGPDPQKHSTPRLCSTQIQWPKTVTEREQAACNEEAVAEEENQRHRQVEAETLEAACLEDWKKNKVKYNPICNAPVPSGPIVIPCTTVQAKMRKGAYSEKAATSQEDLDYVVICQDKDNSQVLVIATSSELPTWRAIGKGESALKLITDEELSWEDFMEATPHIITAMKDNEWAEDHIEMFIKFWTAIHTHPWQHIDDPFSQKALLAYQAQQRQLWHLTVGTAHNWSLAEINEQVLQCTKDATITNAHKEELKALKEVSPHHQADP